MQSDTASGRRAGGSGPAAASPGNGQQYLSYAEKSQGVTSEEHHLYEVLLNKMQKLQTLNSRSCFPVYLTTHTITAGKNGKYRKWPGGNEDGSEE
jgi:hypothetical protein